MLFLDERIDGWVYLNAEHEVHETLINTEKRYFWA